MAPSSSTSSKSFLIWMLVSVFFSVLSAARAQFMSPVFYARSCPNAQTIVRSTMAQAIAGDPTIGASILRLFFHDCFVNGCDGSVLLDDEPGMIGEKNAPPNRNSLRGYELIDSIKFRLEQACRGTVSCSDILALAAGDAVNLLGGPSWIVPLGRRDSLTASMSAAVSNLPPASATVFTLLRMFAAKGLNARDMVALSGAHTVGRAQCANYRPHIYNDADVDPGFASFRKQTCPAVTAGGNLAPLDVTTPTRFDNGYFVSLMARKGLLHSDQELFNNGPIDGLARLYAGDQRAFFTDFAAAMLKMGNICPLMGGAGEVRLNCRRAN